MKTKLFFCITLLSVLTGCGKDVCNAYPTTCDDNDHYGIECKTYAEYKQANYVVCQDEIRCGIRKPVCNIWGRCYY